MLTTPSPLPHLFAARSGYANSSRQKDTNVNLLDSSWKTFVSLILKTNFTGLLFILALEHGCNVWANANIFWPMRSWDGMHGKEQGIIEWQKVMSFIILLSCYNSTELLTPRLQVKQPKKKKQNKKTLLLVNDHNSDPVTYSQSIPNWHNNTKIHSWHILCLSTYFTAPLGQKKHLTFSIFLN